MSIVNINALKSQGCVLHWSGGNCSTNTGVKSITPAGSVTQILPFPGAGIGMFDGTGDYLYPAESTDWDFGSGDFTIETDVYFGLVNSAQHVIVDSSSSDGNSYAWSFKLNSNNKLYAFTANGATAYAITGGTTIIVNTWYHIAFVKSGTSLYLFLNGVLDATPVTCNISTNANVIDGIRIGRRELTSDYAYLNGYLSELRISNVARYTANFTPPRKQLENDANTKLLLHFLGSGQSFVDSSPSPKTITVPDAGVTNHAKQLSSPVGSGVAYFNGNGDYLMFPNTVDGGDLDLSTGDFTVEGLFNLNSISGVKDLIWIGGDTGGSSYSAYRILVSSGNIMFLAHRSTDGPDWTISTPSLYLITVNTWYHIALVRLSGVLTIYLNGVSIYSNSSYISSIFKYSTTGIYNSVGSANYSIGGGWYNFLSGVISEFRITKGIARYTGAFTPSTQPFKPDPKTMLLLHMDGVGNAFYDSSDPPGDNGFPILPDGTSIVPNGTFTSNKLKSGLNCYKMDGSTNYITVADHDSWNIFGGDFTICGWVKFDSIAAERGLLGQYVDANNYWAITWATANVIQLYGVVSSTNNFNYTCPLTPVTGTWYFITIQKSGSTCLMYINCTPQTVTTSQAWRNTTDIASVLSIGRTISTYYMNGNEKDWMLFKDRVLTLDQLSSIMNETYIY